MDGENNGKPYEQMDDLGGFHPPFKETPMKIQVFLRRFWRPFARVIKSPPDHEIRLESMNSTIEKRLFFFGGEFFNRFKSSVRLNVWYIYIHWNVEICQMWVNITIHWVSYIIIWCNFNLELSRWLALGGAWNVQQAWPILFQFVCNLQSISTKQYQSRMTRCLFCFFNTLGFQTPFVWRSDRTQKTSQANTKPQEVWLEGIYYKAEFLFNFGWVWVCTHVFIIMHSILNVSTCSNIWKLTSGVPWSQRRLFANWNLCLAYPDTQCIWYVYPRLVNFAWYM